MSDERTPTDRVRSFLMESDYYHSIGIIVVVTGLTPFQVSQIVHDLKGMGLVRMRHARKEHGKGKEPVFAWAAREITS